MGILDRIKALVFNSPYLLHSLLFILWASVQTGVYIKFGVSEASDSDLYISNARLLLEGQVPTDRGLWYLSYSFVIAVFFSIGATLPHLVLFQILCSGIAAIALYKLSKYTFQNSTIALLTVVQYLAWIKIHHWNVFIYTESLFISFSIISFTILVTSTKKWQYSIAALFIVFTFFIRPTGIAFIIGIVGYVSFLTLQRNKYAKRNIAIVAILALTLGIVLINTMLQEYIFYFIDSYSKAELIYPNVSLGFRPPNQLTLPSATHPPIIQLALFIILNPWYFLQLFVLKFLLFFGNIKPYFSLIHNIIIACVLFPIYGFAIYGYRKIPLGAIKIFTISYISVQALTISMTSENWDGRFLITILPFVFLLSSYGIYEVLNSIKE